MRSLNEMSLASDQTDRLKDTNEPTLSGLVRFILDHPITVLRTIGWLALVYAVIISITISFGV